MIDCLRCHAPLQQNGKNAVGMRLYLFSPVTGPEKRVMARERMEGLNLGLSVSQK